MKLMKSIRKAAPGMVPAPTAKSLLSILLVVATLITALVVLPISLETEVGATTIADGTKAASVFWDSDGYSNFINNTDYKIFSFRDLWNRRGEANATNTSYHEPTADGAWDYELSMACAYNDADPWLKFNISGISITEFRYMVVVGKTGYEPSGSKYGNWILLPYLMNGSAIIGTSTGVRVSRTWTAYTIDLRSCASAGWTTFTQLRFDYLADSSAWVNGVPPTIPQGAEYLLDSIGFFKNKEDADFFAHERTVMRTQASTLTYTPCSLMNSLITDHHNCTTAYVNTDGGTIRYKATATCNDDCFNPSYPGDLLCTGAYDTQSTLTTRLDLTNSFPYMVIAYRLGTPLNQLPGTGKKRADGTAYDASNERRNYIAVYPYLDGSTRLGVSDAYFYDTHDVYYAGYTNLSAMKGTYHRLTGVRIDPFEYSYVTVGSTLYIKAIIFCQTKAQADKIVGDYIKAYYPYEFSLTYNKNTPIGTTSPTVTSMPRNIESVRTATSPYTFPVSSDIPARDNYDFLGWSTTSGVFNTVNYTSGSSWTVTGGSTSSKNNCNLYAVWQIHHAYLTVGLTDAAYNAHPDQIFIFEITGTTVDSACISVQPTYVAVGQSLGKPSETLYLPVGTYRVELVNAWNWRYGATSQSKNLTTRNASVHTMFGDLPISTNRWFSNSASAKK